MTLYELTAEYLQLLEWAEDPELDPEVLEDTLEGLTGEIEIKADGYAKVIAQLKADAAALKAEIDRLTERKRKAEDSVERLTKSLGTAMILMDKRKFKTDLFSFTIQKNPPAVVMDEKYVYSVPEDYLIYQEPKVDKTKIKADLKAGKDLSSIAHLEQTESLRIK